MKDLNKFKKTIAFNVIGIIWCFIWFMVCLISSILMFVDDDLLNGFIALNCSLIQIVCLTIFYSNNKELLGAIGNVNIKEVGHD